EVAGLTAGEAGLAVAGGTEARTGIDTGGDAHGELGGLGRAAFAVARRAGLFDFLAGAAAGRTDLGEGDDAAAAADLTGAAAGGTGDFLGTGFRAGAVAALAGDGTAEGDFPFGALGRFFERDFEVVAQIGAVAVGTAASTAATEKLLENATSAATTAAGVEDFAEDVEGIVESTA